MKLHKKIVYARENKSEVVTPKNDESKPKSVTYYKFVDQNNQNFKMDAIRYWKNKNECTEALLPCYPNKSMEEIQQENNLKLVEITNNENQLINVINWGPEAMLEITYIKPNDIIDYVLVQTIDKEQTSTKYDNFFFYLLPQDLSVYDTTNASCRCLYVLDQWMTFAHWFFHCLDVANPKVKFLKYFENRFLLNEDYEAGNENTKA